MKFDYIIQNPPYNKSLHLDFLEKGLDLLTEKGRMVIIEPATWLINIRKNGKGKRYDAIKNRIQWHDSLAFDYNKWPSIGKQRTGFVSFKEEPTEFDTKYPMWFKAEKPPYEELLIFTDEDFK